ncbi:hypothetical protein BaRGS_00035739 [Batillaria attramentaria]|uniref:Uncharacterized protein n=1 Tax=Batillaria attramentaria TaxID=370345 RepID=A0ABD0JEL9_9CAEN
MKGTVRLHLTRSPPPVRQHMQVLEYKHTGELHVARYTCVSTTWCQVAVLGQVWRLRDIRHDPPSRASVPSLSNVSSSYLSRHLFERKESE